MKKIILGLSLVTIIFMTNANAKNAQGEAMFQAKGCAVCHKKDMDTIGPSLATIATAYAGKESTIIAYLKGSGTPIVDPARAPVMNPQLVKIRTLFDEDMKALAEHIISSNDRPF